MVPARDMAPLVRGGGAEVSKQERKDSFCSTQSSRRLQTLTYRCRYRLHNLKKVSRTRRFPQIYRLQHMDRFVRGGVKLCCEQLWNMLGPFKCIKDLPTPSWTELLAAAVTSI